MRQDLNISIYCGNLAKNIDNKNLLRKKSSFANSARKSYQNEVNIRFKINSDIL